MKQILITGVAGFIGSHTVNELLKHNNVKVTGLIRPRGKNLNKKLPVGDIKFVEIDLCDCEGLRNWLNEQNFDVIVHIGAIRNGRDFPKSDYYKANVISTMIFAKYCLKNSSKLVYCSSVGIFGTIPSQLPANESTARFGDNFYHYTKIKSENYINNMIKKGLNAVVIRPSITYGKYDYGFPYKLCKLIDSNLMVIPNKKVFIHLTDVHTLATAFANVSLTDDKLKKRYIVADYYPVSLDKLVSYIAIRLNKNRNYTKRHTIPYLLFKTGENLSKLLKSPINVTRFALISKSWYYNVEDTYKDIMLEKKTDIDRFDDVVQFYLDTRE